MNALDVLAEATLRLRLHLQCLRYGHRTYRPTMSGRFYCHCCRRMLGPKHRRFWS